MRAKISKLYRRLIGKRDAESVIKSRVSQDELALHLDTELTRGELEQRLKSYSPWRHEVIFSNGFRTSELEQGRLFNTRPLGKVKQLENFIPLKEMYGARALDVGCNSGHNSIYLTQEHRMRVTGLDVVPRHIEVSEFLSSFVKGELPDFVRGDATTFRRPREFDLILHYGTLYHLPNPLLALRNAADSLRPGGYLALETSSYNAEDPELCRWIRGHNNDDTNFWALSKHVIEEALQMYGLSEVQLISEVELKKEFAKVKGISRVQYIARKPMS